jgi:two-component system OmpR family response regulator
LLESEESSVPFLQELLASAGEAVVRVTDAERAFELVARESFDLVVVASSTWDASATDACRRLFASRASRVLGVAGPCGADVRAAALAAGADDFVTYPIDVGEVVARVGALLRRRALHRRGPLAIDPLRRTVEVDSSTVSFTAREYELFYALVERNGEVVTREELLARVSRKPSGGASNWIDVHMSRIREKLGRRARMIETVRGVGYRLRTE